MMKNRASTVSSAAISSAKVACKCSQNNISLLKAYSCLNLLGRKQICRLTDVITWFICNVWGSDDARARL